MTARIAMPSIAGQRTFEPPSIWTRIYPAVLPA